MPSVRVVVQQLADVGAHQRGRAAVPVPELGPEAVMDQLTVMVYDVFAAGPPEPATGTLPAQLAQVTRLLTDLRRSL
jgi:hypothetical protein